MILYKQDYGEPMTMELDLADTLNPRREAALQGEDRHLLPQIVGLAHLFHLLAGGAHAHGGQGRDMETPGRLLVSLHLACHEPAQVDDLRAVELGWGGGTAPSDATYSFSRE